MAQTSDRNGKEVLEQIARRVMQERGFQPDFSASAMNELVKITDAVQKVTTPVKEMRNLLWSSIDNDDSLDLDQLTVAEALPDDRTRICVAVADVDNLVKKNTALDSHAQQNTTSVYTAAKIFPMLPERLSTDLTSLNCQKDRSAIVIDMIVNSNGDIEESMIYMAMVRNQAKLAYHSLGAWLENKAPMPEAVAHVPGLAENLQIQDYVAEIFKEKRHERGALQLQTMEAHPLFAGNEIQNLEVDEPNRAKQLIEDFMIAANDRAARFLKDKNVASIRRVVRSPLRWSRIVEIASLYNYQLPVKPDSKSLADFLEERKVTDPLRFPDLSLTVIKLLGPGEYVVELPGEEAPGHFGLAVKDYTHSTAPNRRFADLITQRIIKATLAGLPMPYNEGELKMLTKHCTEKEDEANKVERLVIKSAAAMLMSSRIGDKFDALCTGAADKGTWVRVLHPPVEGKLINGFKGVDVGDRLEVRLIHTDIENGFIDFERVQSNR